MPNTSVPGPRARLALRRFSTDELGATSIEYGLIAALMAVVIIGGLTVLSTSNGGSWGATATKASEAMAQ